MKMIGTALLLVTIFCYSTFAQNISHRIVQEFDLLRQRLHNAVVAYHNYVTNITEINAKLLEAVNLKNSIETKEMNRFFKTLDLNRIDNDLLKQQLNLSRYIGENILNKEDFKDLQAALAAMSRIFAMTTVCSYRNPLNCGLQLEPDIENIFSKSRDPNELKWYWRQWYDKSGTPVRQNFAKYVELTRKAANLENFKSRAEYWLESYKDPDFKKSIDKSFLSILPLYLELHAYVRYRLNQYYGDDIVSMSGVIPMHLLGDVWAQDWSNIIDIVRPFPNKLDINVTFELHKQNYTAPRLVKLADDFFQSLGFEPLSAAFWNCSMLTRPTDRKVACYSSAFDFYDNDGVCIHMCIEINNYYFHVVHHELGHIQNFLQYKHQPIKFREPANFGFAEAIGDCVQLSVTTPKHLKLIGLSSISKFDKERRINHLFAKALHKVVMLPFAYALEFYRSAVFRNEIAEKFWNQEFWSIRSILTGLAPPLKRTEENFDPPAKYHISNDVEYLRYFASCIFQFQFYKSLCFKANQYVPNDPERSLDNCDIYGNKEAGLALRKFLALGSSKHWKKALQEFTGETEMSSTAILEYFDPLYKWLQQENKRFNISIGWD